MSSEIDLRAGGLHLSAAAANTPATPGAARGASRGRWVAPGERVTVAGTAIEGGFFYLDASLDPELNPLDSCVVGLAYEVASDVAPAPADGVASGAAAIEHGPTAAWLSYAALTATQRRAWVDWLASDRTARNVHVGYLNLYLYGLERRVLLDGAQGEVDDDEYAAIAHELRRLLKLSGDWAFQTHVENLIESVTVLQIAPDRLYLETPTVRTTRGYQVPFTVRVAFGQAVVDNAPIPAEWAFAWASLDSAITRKPPLGRVPDAFRALFIKLYRARTRDGMRMAPNRTRLRFPDTAFPALRELDVPESVGVLPDLSAVTTPRGRFQQLVNDCVDTLGPYGRYIARSPGSEGTLDAALMLSVDLWPEALRQQLTKTAQAAHEEIEVVRFGDLLAAFRTSTALSRDKVVNFVSVLGQMGVGVEPDIRTGARTPKLDDRVALFAIDPATRLIDENYAYLSAALMIDVAATLAMADGEATHPELMQMHEHIEHAMHLSAAQRQRLKARMAVQLGAPATLASLKKRLEPLASDDRQVLASFLVQTANADGVVTPAEVRLLEKIYRMLELDTQQLYSDLHQDASSPAQSRRVAADPTDRASAPNARLAGKGSTDQAPEPLRLDPARISALQTETAQVSALLAQVFAQDATDEPEAQPGASADEAHVHGAGMDRMAHAQSGRRIAPDERAAQLELLPPSGSDADTFQGSAHALDAPIEDEPGHTSPSTLLGLDDAHSTFLRLLVSRPRWTRQELLDAAADLELMLDGAIEQVNEASLDHWDEPLTDGDDPVEINQELAQRLAA